MTQQPYAYPPQQGQYPAPQPQQPAPYGGPPQQPQAPQQYPQPVPYAPPQQQPYGQQPAAYPPPVQQGMPQQPPPAQGTLNDYFNQRSTGGGPALKWQDKQINHTVMGVVARDVGPGDVEQQTNTQNVPQTFNDGSPKWVLKIPLNVAQSPEHPDGLAVFYAKGQAKDEIQRALAAAGGDEAPRAGAGMAITLVQRRPSGAGYNPTNIFRIEYTPPEQMNGGQATQQPAPASQPQQVQQQQQAPQAAPAPPAQPAHPQPTGAGAFPQPQVQQQAPQAQQTPQPTAQQPQVQGQMQFPPDFDANQQALLAQLTGQQQIQAAG